MEYLYPSNYSTLKIDMEQYKLYDKNLELAFIYGNSTTEEQINSFDARFVDMGYDQTRDLIKLKYTNDTAGEIGAKIRDVSNEPGVEHAFWKSFNRGWKVLLVVLSNQSREDIVASVPNSIEGTYNITWANAKNDASTAEILKAIYKCIELDNPDKKYINIDNALTTNRSVTTLPVEIKSSTIINIKAEPKIIQNMSSGDFITGKVTIAGNTSSPSTPKLDDIRVHLMKGNTKVAEGQTDENGNYGLAYPGSGTYYLKFMVKDTNKYNGQYYQFRTFNDADVGPIPVKKKDPDTRETNKAIKESNIQEIKDELKDVEINYEKENTILSSTSLWGKSNSFTIKPYDDDIDGDDTTVDIYDPSEHRIKANVFIDEREKFSLTVDTDVNQYKIILSNGQVFKQYNLSTSPNNENFNLRLFNITMDTKLSYGAKLFVEYKITVKNNSSIDCKGYTLLNRFESLEFNKEQYLLHDSNEKNSDKWGQNITDISNEINNKLIEGNDNTNTMTFLKLNDTGLNANSEEIHYITLTRPLDAEDGSTIFNGSSELVSYKNDEGRRNYSKKDLTGVITENIIKSGIYCYSGVDDEHIGISEDIAILPPTGFDLLTFCMLALSTTICFIGFKYVITNKIYINFKKQKIKRKWNK